MWLELILFALVVYFVCIFSWVDSRTKELANKIPGPFALPLLGNILEVPRNGAAILKRRQEMIEKYGDVVRLWFGKNLIVILSDPQDIENIMSSTIHIEKSTEYKFLHPWLGTGLLTSSGDKWHQRRKAITPTFHFKILEQFIDVFNRNGDILVECLTKKANSTSFDIQPYISRYALDVICESAMGTKVNAQLDCKSDYVKAVRRICSLIYMRITVPWLRLNSMFALIGGFRSQTESLKILHGLTNKVIREKQNASQNNFVNSNGVSTQDDTIGVKKKTAFLELLLKMSENSNSTFTSNEDIREEVDTFMFEGHDTTTSSLCFTIFLLGKHPEIQEKVYEELKEKGITGNPTYQDLLDMKYLERVIRESLRLYPAVPIVARTLKEDVTIKSGYTLPAGCVVGMSCYFIQRNKKYYKNPNEFNPDNFLIENTVNRHPYAYIPFSAGPRNCIGQKYAMLELKSAITKVILNYKILYAGEDLEPIPKSNLVLQSANGFHIKLIQRSP